MICILKRRFEVQEQCSVPQELIKAALEFRVPPTFSEGAGWISPADPLPILKPRKELAEKAFDAFRELGLSESMSKTLAEHIERTGTVPTFREATGWVTPQ